jgi:hemerythrin
MPVAKWDDSYKTGFELVDAQHQELFSVVNDLYDAILAGRDRELVGPTLEKLSRYTVEHFRAEEALMVETNYPALDKHRTQHWKLTKDVQDLRRKYESGEAVLSITLASFLANWLRRHIKEEDMLLIRYVQSRPHGLAAKSKG